MRIRKSGRLAGAAAVLGGLAAFGAAGTASADHYTPPAAACCDTGCCEQCAPRYDPLCNGDAGLLTINGRPFIISTRRNVAWQIRDAFECVGYGRNVRWYGSTVRIYFDHEPPQVCWTDGIYGAQITCGYDSIEICARKQVYGITRPSVTVHRPSHGHGHYQPRPQPYYPAHRPARYYHHRPHVVHCPPPYRAPVRCR